MTKPMFEVQGEDSQGNTRTVEADLREYADKLVVLFKRYQYDNIRVVERIA